MRVLVVSGIWPPDVGGPASHAPEIAAGLAGRGHTVEVVTTADTAPATQPYRVRWVSRALPPGMRHAAVSALVARRARHADVVYAASMVGRSTTGAAVARTPLVVKVSGDPAYERSLRRGLYSGTLADFQHAHVGAPARALRTWRTLTTARAAHLVCPSEFLRGIVLTWGVAPERVSVVPNAVPPIAPSAPRDELRARFGMDGDTLAFAGRLTPAKALDVAFDAMSQLDGVTLLVAGDGEERARLEARAPANVRLLGGVDRHTVVDLLAAADAVVLSSAWENFPHVLVEALAAGTPIAATAVGGVPEIVADGENGLLATPNDPGALAQAIRRVLDDRVRLAAGARSSAERFAPERVLDRLEAILERSAG